MHPPRSVLSVHPAFLALLATAPAYLLAGQETEPIGLVGVVVDATSDDPVAEVLVQVAAGRADSAAATGRGGRFVLTGVHPADGMALITANGSGSRPPGTPGRSWRGAGGSGPGTAVPTSASTAGAAS